ncbi:MAG: transposase [Chloroflexota bacterium]|nr:transposase [Chloroflexota bacterium]
MRLNPRKLRSSSRDNSECKGTLTGTYFITICTKDCGSLFGDVVDGEMRLNEFGKVVRDEWLRMADIRSNLKLDDFVVMPNHLHGIVVVDIDGSGEAQSALDNEFGLSDEVDYDSIGRVIGQFKSIVTRRINTIQKRRGSAVWQRSCHKHNVCDEKELYAIREYIVGNPARWTWDAQNPQSSLGQQGSPSEYDLSWEQESHS